MNAEEMQIAFIGQQQNVALALKPVAYEEWLKLLQPGTSVRMQDGQGVTVIQIIGFWYEFTTGRPLVWYGYKGLFGRRKYRIQDIESLVYRLLLPEPPPWSKSSV